MMMADHKSDHDQHHHPESSPTKSLTKIISLPAHLADMNNLNSNQLTTDSTGALKGTGTPKDGSLTRGGTTTTSLRKQIQFNLDEKAKSSAPPRPPSSMKDKRSSSQGPSSSHPTSSSLHETLKQIKMDEIRKRKSRASISDLRKRKKKHSRFDYHAMVQRMEETKRDMYHFLERPVGPFGFLYRMFTLAIILGSILIGASATLKAFEKQSVALMHNYEIFVTVYFSIEYALRVWSSGTFAKYKNIWGRIKFMLTPLLVIESVLIGVNIVILVFFPEALSVMRFFQLIRFLYIDRQAQTWIILMKVIYQHRFELLSSFYIGIIILLFSSYFIMLVEKPYSDENDDNHFHSYADAIYWSIITMTTIGYGDRSPRTFLGKIVATSLCIAGVAFWTLPGGIIGSGFALKVEQKNRQKQFNRLVPAAVQLIQAWWRMKATIFISSSNVSCLVATVSTFDVSKPIYSSSLRRLKRRLESTSSSTYDELATMFYGLDAPTVHADDGQSSRNKRPSIVNMAGSSGGDDEEEKDEKNSSPLLAPNNAAQQQQQQHSIGIPIVRSNQLTFTGSQTRPGGSSHSSNATTHDDSVIMQLSPEHLMLIRTILLLKFFVARRKFKLAFKPYDFKDVIEKYTQGNMEMATKMKELQRKFDHISSALTNTMMGAGVGQQAPYMPPRSMSPSPLSSGQQASFHHDTTFHQVPRPLYTAPSSSSSFNRLSFRGATGGVSRPYSSPPPSVICEGIVLDEDKFVSRMQKMENELSELNSKIDKLIRLQSSTTTTTDQQ